MSKVITKGCPNCGSTTLQHFSWCLIHLTPFNDSKEKGTRIRLEQDGLMISSSEHWETWEGVFYSYVYKYGTWTQKKAMIHIPQNIVQHLKLTHKQKIRIAIQKVKEK